MPPGSPHESVAFNQLLCERASKRTARYGNSEYQTTPRTTDADSPRAKISAAARMQAVAARLAGSHEFFTHRARVPKVRPMHSSAMGAPYQPKFRKASARKENPIPPLTAARPGSTVQT